MKFTQPVYLVAARRSPIGRLGSGVKSLTAADLALQVAQAIVPEALKPAVDQVILGQVLQAGCTASRFSLKTGSVLVTVSSEMVPGEPCEAW